MTRLSVTTAGRHGDRVSWGRIRFFLLPVAMCAAVLLGAASPVTASSFEIEYRIRILPDKGLAKIAIVVDQETGGLSELSATLEADHWFDFEGPGVAVAEEGGAGRKVIWTLPRNGGTMRYTTRIDRVRDDTEYDSRCNPDWMVTRAEDLIPPMAARFDTDAQAASTMRFEVPPSWEVVAAYPRVDGSFVVEQEHRRVDQPKGWLVAGKLDRVEEDIAGVRVVVAAPAAHRARIRDAATFVRFTLPSLAEAAGGLPARIAIVIADDPMWRGGLAGPRSVYLHADRPLVEGDGTSPLLHEIVHVMSHALAAADSDWIVEGLAEWYSLEILRRSGAVSEQTHDASLDRMRRRAEGVQQLGGESRGAQTARAVEIFDGIDDHLRDQGVSGGLDPVLARLMAQRTEQIDRASFISAVREATGLDVSSLVPGD